jgi:RNA polymerase-binding transcription factor DksA
VVEEETEGQEAEGQEPAVADAAEAEPQPEDEAPDAQYDREQLEQLRNRLQKKFH